MKPRHLLLAALFWIVVFQCSGCDSPPPGEEVATTEQGWTCLAHNPYNGACTILRPDLIFSTQAAPLPPPTSWCACPACDPAPGTIQVYSQNNFQQFCMVLPTGFYGELVNWYSGASSIHSFKMPLNSSSGGVVTCIHPDGAGCNNVIPGLPMGSNVASGIAGTVASLWVLVP